MKRFVKAWSRFSRLPWSIKWVALAMLCCALVIGQILHRTYVDGTSAGSVPVTCLIGDLLARPSDFDRQAIRVLCYLEQGERFTELSPSRGDTATSSWIAGRLVNGCVGDAGLPRNEFLSGGYAGLVLVEGVFRAEAWPDSLGLLEDYYRGARPPGIEIYGIWKVADIVVEKPSVKDAAISKRVLIPRSQMGKIVFSEPSQPPEG